MRLDVAGAFLGAAALAAVLTPLMAVIARRCGVVAEVRRDRWGQRPIPLLGGVAVVSAMLVVVVVLAEPSRPLLVVLIGAVGALVLGLVDDVRGLRPTSKLVGQVVVASTLAFGGVQVEIAGPELGMVLTLAWVVGLMNAMNLIDNMDGLAAGIAAIAAAVLVLMALPLAPWAGLVAAALAGSCVGFLVYNFAPARIYLGDAGSLALGYLLAALSLVLTNQAASNVGLAVLGPLLVLAVPIFDTTLVTFVRYLEGRPISQGGRDHSSHRLAARGLGNRGAVLVLYGVAAAFALVGLFANALGLAVLPLTGLVIIAMVLFGAFLAEHPAVPAVESPPEARATYTVVSGGRVLLRYGAEIALDVSAMSIALFSSFLIRFEALPPQAWFAPFVQVAPVLISFQLAGFVLSGVYRTLWRNLHITDLLAIMSGAILATAASGILVFGLLGWSTQSRAVFVLDGLLVTLLAIGSRAFLLWLRHWFALRSRRGERRVLIVGAGALGEAALRLLLGSESPRYFPCGFLDDDPGKHKRRIATVPILGRIGDLERAVESTDASLIVVALEHQPALAEQLRERGSRLGIEVRVFSSFALVAESPKPLG